MSSPLPILSVENLNVTMSGPLGELSVVRKVSLELHRGETLGIVGESGSGKSVTALALMRLLPRNATVKADCARLDGTELTALSERQMADIRGPKIAMIFQDPMTALNPVLTIGRQLTETYLRHRRATLAEARDRAAALLDRVGVSRPKERLDVYPHQLSGGLCQRVVIAMALICDPEVIIADEPTTALDVTVQAQVLDILAGLQSERGLAIIFISHDIGVVARIAHRVQVMYAGETVETGAMADVLSRPSHRYTQALLSAVPRRGMRWDRDRLGTVTWSGDTNGGDA